MANASLSVRLRDAAFHEQRDILSEHVGATLRSLLALADERSLPRRQPFMDMGMDSVMLSKLRTELSSALGRELPVSVTFDYPTLDALVDFLQSTVDVAPPSPPQVALTHQPEAGTLGGLFDQLSSLSDDEAEQLLAEKLSTSDK